MQRIVDVRVVERGSKTQVQIRGRSPGGSPTLLDVVQVASGPEHAKAAAAAIAVWSDQGRFPVKPPRV